MNIDNAADAINITSGGPEYAAKTASALVPIFKDDPVIRYMLCSLSDSARSDYMQQYFNTLTKAAALNDAVFKEADDWACVSIWMPPEKRVDNPWTLFQAGFVGCLVKLGVGGCKRMLMDYQSQSDACKKRGLPTDVERYWYLFFIGTDEKARGRGLASKVIRRQQVEVTQKELPIWLEATTPKSRDIYKKCGFDVVGEFVLGEGSHSAEGEIEKGGPGVRVWAMFWRPQKDTKSGSQ